MLSNSIFSLTSLTSFSSFSLIHRQSLVDAVLAANRSPSLAGNRHFPLYLFLVTLLFLAAHRSPSLAGNRHFPLHLFLVTLLFLFSGYANAMETQRQDYETNSVQLQSRSIFSNIIIPIYRTMRRIQSNYSLVLGFCLLYLSWRVTLYLR